MGKSRNPKNELKPIFVLLYGSIIESDAWNVFVRIFEDFKKSKFQFEIVIRCNLYKDICTYIHMFIYIYIYIYEYTYINTV